MHMNTQNDSSVSDDRNTSEQTWIQWFCELRGNELFCAVDETFIQDSFNLTGLSSQFSYYEKAMDILLDAEDEDESCWDEDVATMVAAEAEVLYGMIHSRFIITPRGLYLMYKKYIDGSFGTCPRTGCDGIYVLPAGATDIMNSIPVRFYCPGCNELYLPLSKRYEAIDGAYFGTTFPHLFFLTYPDLLVNANRSVQKYVPKIFGFRIHSNAYEIASEANQKEKELKKKYKISY